jgi:protein O-mannosyl-transferase
MTRKPNRKAQPPSSLASPESNSNPSLRNLFVDAFLSVLIFGVVLASFWPTLQNGFLDWDDSGMFLENIDYRGLKAANIKWMFSTFHYAHYHPITWLTLGLDYEMFEMNPAGYHRTSMVIHGLNAVLLYFLIKRILTLPVFPRTGDRSWMLKLCCVAGALFYAIHPLRVESVAWATERRDVVSGFFYLLTLMAYVQANIGPRRTLWFVLSVVFFLLSFLSKAWGITLPLVLLILDAYPLQRFARTKSALRPWGKLLLEKIPFCVIAVALAIVAYKGQVKSGIIAADFGLLKRLATMAYGLSFYLWKTLVPAGLSPLYLLPLNMDPLEMKYLGCGALLLAMTIFALRTARRWPWLVAAWFCYGLIVSPVSGLAQRGEQIAADRYSYLCVLPFAVLLAGGLWRLAAEPRFRTAAILSGLLVTGGIGTLSYLTFQQTKVWHDEETLWQQAIKVDPGNYVGYNGRGLALLNKKNYDAAIGDFNEALRFNPKKMEAFSNRGMAHYYKGNYDAAQADFTAALEIKPQFQTVNNRGAIKEMRGDVAGAISDYSLALQMNPRDPKAYFNRARLKRQQGDLAGALEDFNQALHYDPRYADAYLRRANIFIQRNDPASALRDLNTALEVAQPNWEGRTEAQQKLAQLKGTAR